MTKNAEKLKQEFYRNVEIYEITEPVVFHYAIGTYSTRAWNEVMEQLETLIKIDSKVAPHLVEKEKLVLESMKLSFDRMRA